MEMQPLLNFDLDPGPVDQSVLVWQHEHRSAAIWEDEVPPRELTCRHKLLGMRDWPLDPLVCRQLIEFGLYGVYKVAFIQLDYALITALVERWRPETHTFHLPVGEITITLQDVNILLGLRVDGPAITGSTKYNWADLCEDLLGRRPGPKDLHGSHISLGWLRDNFRNLPPDPDEDTLKRHTRAFVLALMSGFLYGDKSKHDVALTFLPLLRDFDEVARLSWGSATLALLYRELCRASKRTVSTICGPLVLLQLWAWERLHVGRPGRLRDVGASFIDGIDGPLPDPLGCRWRASLSHKENPRGGLDFYRDQLDQQKDDQVIWQPYTPDLLAKLPPICLSGQNIWRTVAPLICFDVVEWHRPDRVLRQFALRQMIPAPCDNEKTLHAIDKRGKSEYDWSARHSRHIELWEARESSIVFGEPEYGPMDYNDPYMEWYRRITRRIISPMKERRPGQFQPTGFAFQLLVQRVAAIYARSKASLEEALTVDTARRTLQDILDLCAGALQLNAPLGSLSNGSASQAPTPEPFPMLPPPMSTETMQKPLSAETADVALNGIGSTDDVSAVTMEVLPPWEPHLPSSSQKPVFWPSGGKLTFSWICDVMLAFDWSSRNLPPSEFSSVLPINVFDDLVLSAAKILKKEPNCVRINSNKAKVIVVGDLHGQLHDLLFLMQDAGFPNDDQFYVFNGNYVDKGAWGLETFLLLLCWKVFLPERVYLLRGNHESESCTSVYGFGNEVLSKYGEKGPYVYKKCLDCFQLLPLASLIAGKVFTTHGGLFRNTSSFLSERSRKRKRNQKKQKDNNVLETENEFDSLSLGSLEELSKAKRRVIDPPTKGSNLIPGDILWSNPSTNAGLCLNKERDIGLLWGPDCTAKFLQDNDLKLIIRGNEGPDARRKPDGLPQMDEGYAKDHEGLITLFSAPDYPQFQDTEERYNNKGAYIVLQIPGYEEPEIHVFEAVSPRPKAEAYYDFRCMTDTPRNLGHKNSDLVDSPPSIPDDKDMSDSSEKVENRSADVSDSMEVDEKDAADSIEHCESRIGEATVSGTLASADKDVISSPERLKNGSKDVLGSKTQAVNRVLSDSVEESEFRSRTENTSDKGNGLEPPLAYDSHVVDSGEPLGSRTDKGTDAKSMAVDDKPMDDTAEESESRIREANDVEATVSSNMLEQKAEKERTIDSPEGSRRLSGEANDSEPRDKSTAEDKPMDNTAEESECRIREANDVEATVSSNMLEQKAEKERTIDSPESSRCVSGEAIDSEPRDKGTAECTTDRDTDRVTDGSEKLECSTSKVNDSEGKDMVDSAMMFECKTSHIVDPEPGTVNDENNAGSSGLSGCTTSKPDDCEPMLFHEKLIKPEEANNLAPAAAPSEDMECKTSHAIDSNDENNKGIRGLSKCITSKPDDSEQEGVHQKLTDNCEPEAAHDKDPGGFGDTSESVIQIVSDSEPKASDDNLS